MLAALKGCTRFLGTLSEEAWIRAAETRLLGASELRPAIEKLRTQYQRAFPQPHKKAFFGNVQIKACVAVKDADLLMECIQYAPMNVLALNQVMMFYREQGKMEECEELLKGAIEGGTFLSCASFTTVISGWLDARQGVRAAAVYDAWLQYWEREGQHRSIRPRASVLLHLCGRLFLEKRLAELERVLGTFIMIPEGEPVRWVVWRYLLQTLLAAGQHEKAIARHRWLLEEYLPQHGCIEDSAFEPISEGAEHAVWTRELAALLNKWKQR